MISGFATTFAVFVIGRWVTFGANGGPISAGFTFVLESPGITGLAAGRELFWPAVVGAEFLATYLLPCLVQRDLGFFFHADFGAGLVQDLVTSALGGLFGAEVS